jgi:hypothetical protein
MEDLDLTQTIHGFLNEVRKEVLAKVEKDGEKQKWPERMQDLYNALYLVNVLFVSVLGNGVFFVYTNKNSKSEKRIFVFVHCSTPRMEHGVKVSDFKFDEIEGEPVEVELWPYYSLIEKFNLRKYYNDSVHCFCINEQLHSGMNWPNFGSGGDEHDEPIPIECISSHKYVIQP